METPDRVKQAVLRPMLEQGLRFLSVTIYPPRPFQLLRLGLQSAEVFLLLLLLFLWRKVSCTITKQNKKPH